MKYNVLVAIVLIAQGAFCASGTPDVKILTVGPPLDSDIVDIYVPPTRANNVYAATRSGVHAYNAKTATWKRIFPPAGESATVAGVSGYAKSSLVIYVVHDKGISVSHDAGETWETILPDGFRVNRSAKATISVNPVTREEAVVSTGHGAWYTKDYGKRWSELSGPTAGTLPTEVSYVTGPKPGIIAKSKNALYFAEEFEGSWQKIAPQAVAVATAPGSGVIALADQKNNLKFIGEGSSDVAKALPIAPQHLALDDSGAAWLSLGERLFVQQAGASAAVAATLESEVSAVVAHPRAPHAAVIAAGPQVFTCGDVPESAEESKKDETPESAALAPTVSSAQELFDAARAASPPLPIVVDAALDYADYHADDVDKWRKHVRMKSLLPSVEMELGQRQWPANVYKTAYSTNQYGITTANDISQDDRVANLDRNSVQLRWDFSNLLFDTDQLHISEEARRRATDRNALIKEVTQLYYKRLELLVKQRQDASKVSSDEALQTIMQLAQSTDLLNEICGRNLFAPNQEQDKK